MSSKPKGNSTIRPSNTFDPSTWRYPSQRHQSILRAIPWAPARKCPKLYTDAPAQQYMEMQHYPWSKHYPSMQQYPSVQQYHWAKKYPLMQQYPSTFQCAETPSSCVPPKLPSCPKLHSLTKGQPLAKTPCSNSRTDTKLPSIHQWSQPYKLFQPQ